MYSVTQAVLMCLYILVLIFITTCVDKGRQQQCSTNNHQHYLQVILYIKLCAYSCFALFTYYHGDQIMVKETGTACCMQQGRRSMLTKFLMNSVKGIHRPSCKQDNETS